MAKTLHVVIEERQTGRRLEREVWGQHETGMKWTVVRFGRYGVRSSGLVPRFALRIVRLDPDTLPNIPSGCECCDSPDEVKR
jgi:hypothetical protein